MQDYVITCCSTVDLDLDFFKSNNIDFIPYTFTMDNKEYYDDYGKSIAIDDFYKAMVDGKVPTTSQINVNRYMEFWKPYLEKGLNVLHITMSSGISGSYNSAVIAMNTLNEEYKAQVYVCDSLAASSGYGLLVKLANDNKDNGLSLKENVEWIENNKLNINHFFYTTDLTYLVRGGRISKVAGFLGGALKICPLLNVDFEGHLVPRQKCRGRKKVMQEMIDKMLENAKDGKEYDGYIYISTSQAFDDANEIMEELKVLFPKSKGHNIYSIGTVIGAHTGPGTVALFFVGNKRVD